jgi:hypothetical protein
MQGVKMNKLPPIHPGEILREEFVKPRGLSQNALARVPHGGMPPRRIKRDREFAGLFIAGAIEMLLEGQTTKALSRLRELVHAGIRRRPPPQDFFTTDPAVAGRINTDSRKSFDANSTNLHEFKTNCSR